MVDRVAGSSRQLRSRAWFSSSRFSARVEHDLLGAGAGDLVVPVEHALLDRDRRERRRVDVVRHAARTSSARDDDAAGRRPGDDDRRPQRRQTARRREPTRTRRADRPRRLAAGRRSASRIGRSGRPPSVVRGRADRGADELRTPRPGRRAAPPWCRTRRSAAPSASVLATATRRPNSDASDPSGRHGLRVRDHEEQEDQHLGRGHDHPPEVEPADRRERPARGHAVSGRGEHPDARRPARARTSPPRRAGAGGG